MPQAYVCPTTLMRMNDREWTLGGASLERKVCGLYKHCCVSSKSLEGDHDPCSLEQEFVVHTHIYILY